MECSVVIADSKHDTTGRKSKDIGSLFKFSETLLLSGLNVPYPQNAVIANGYKFLSQWMSNKTPKFPLKVRSHED
jgi:hypothetical protein